MSFGRRTPPVVSANVDGRDGVGNTSLRPCRGSRRHAAKFCVPRGACTRFAHGREVPDTTSVPGRGLRELGRRARHRHSKNRLRVAARSGSSDVGIVASIGP